MFRLAACSRLALSQPCMPFPSASARTLPTCLPASFRLPLQMLLFRTVRSERLGACMAVLNGCCAQLLCPSWAADWTRRSSDVHRCQPAFMPARPDLTNCVLQLNRDLCRPNANEDYIAPLFRQGAARAACGPGTFARTNA